MIQYLENNYLSAIHSGGEDSGANSTLDMQAKTYVVDILASIAGDIESLATNLNTYVGAQADAVDSLTDQMEVVRNRLTMAKSAVALERFDEMRTVRPAQNDPAALTTGGAKEIGDAEEDQSEGSEGGGIDKEEARRETQAFCAGRAFGDGRRVGVEERLARLDEVGVCLKKESVRRSSESVANFLANPMLAGAAVGQRPSISGSASAHA